MRIIDNRDKKNDLREFKELPAWCVFEAPDFDGLYLKLDYDREIYKENDPSLTGSSANCIRLDYPMTGFKYTLPDTVVRPLDVELHINGVKKF